MSTYGNDLPPMADRGSYLAYMADIGKAPKGFPRRMQAARAAAGLTIDQLAKKLDDEPGLSARSLRDIESGKANVQRSRQRAIIEACDIPSAFIDADLMLLEAVYDALSDIPNGQREEHGDDVLVELAFRHLAEQTAPGVASIEERVAKLEATLEPLSRLLADDEDLGRRLLAGLAHGGGD